MIHWQECMLRLPLFGKVRSVDEARGFLFIEGPAGPNIFGHISTNIAEKHHLIPGSFVDKYCAFIVGTRPTDARQAAVAWCLIDEINWGTHAPCMSPSAWEASRKDYLKTLSTKRLAIVLEAKWYAEIWNGNSESCPKNLADKLMIDYLEDSVARKLLKNEKHVKRFESALRNTPYNIGKRLRPSAIDNLLSAHSAPELARRSNVSLKRFDQVSPRYRPKFLEWILRTSFVEVGALDPSWEGIMSWNYAWEKQVAESLIAEDNLDSDLVMRWFGKLLRREDLTVDIVVKRLQRHPDEEHRWLSCLSENKKVELYLNLKRHEDALRIFENSKSDELLRLILESTVIAVDIESDGEKIQEIGISTGVAKRLLFDSRGNGATDNLDTGLDELVACLDQARLIVGHNILAWDWPILVRHRPELKRRIALWDTLLISFLMKPWDRQFALGGRHHAADDAQDAWTLCYKQLRYLSCERISSLLTASSPNTVSLFRAVFTEHQYLARDYRAPPIWLVEASKSNESPSPNTLFVPHCYLRDASWVPGAHVVNDAEGQCLEIDPTALSAAIRAVAKDRPDAAVLDWVVSNANSKGVQVTESMIPLWLRGPHNPISECLESSLRVSVSHADHVNLSAYPLNEKDYSAAVAVVLHKNVEGITVSSSSLKSEQLPLIVRSRLKEGPPKHNLLLQLLNHKGKRDINSYWVMFDYAAWRLGDGRHFWQYSTITPVDRLPARRIQATSSRPPSVKFPQWKQPFLQPGVENQKAYWSETLMRFLDCVDQSKSSGEIVLLVVTSTSSNKLIDLLNSALIELERTPARYDHWSRSRWMQAGLDSGKNCFVCQVGVFQEWAVAAEESTILIVPVVEALPMAAWWSATPSAYESADQHRTDIDSPTPVELDEEDDADIGADDTEDVALIRRYQNINAPSSSLIMHNAKTLLKTNFDAWFGETGLGRVPEVVLADARLREKHCKYISNCKVITLPPKEDDDTQRRRIDSALSELGGIETKAVSDAFEPLQVFFQEHWNKEYVFKEDSQKPAIEEIRKREADVLVTLPTGEGKSVLFQVPALYRGLNTRRLTLVISPLRALMRDQVEKLWEIGFHESVNYLSSDRPWHEIEDVFQGILDHRVVLLYVAPERLRNNRFIETLEHRWHADSGFEYIVVDEAHCISQWGYEFRPDYFHALERIGRLFRKDDGPDKIPLLFLSATVTAATRKDLERVCRKKNSSQTDYLPFKSKPGKFWNPIRAHIKLEPRSTRDYSAVTTPVTGILRHV